jgi:HSP20 family molecular chaperone IbpA
MKGYNVRTLAAAVAAALLIGGGAGTAGWLVSQSRAAEPDRETTSSISIDTNLDPFDRSNPGGDLFDEMNRLHREMNRTFERAFRRFHQDPDFSVLSRNSFQQSLNVKDEHDKFVVEVNLPDQNVKNVNVNVDGQVLTVSADERS